NMAFKKEVFDVHGRFRTDLGRAGKGMLSGEDTEFGRRVMAAGGQLRYEASALTYHPVKEYRVTQQYFLEWWFNKGRSDAREFGIQPKTKHLFRIPLRLFGGLVLGSARWMIAVEPSHRFICKLQ